MNNCPACGAPLSLRPDTEGFQCSFCHTVFFPAHDDDGVEPSGEPDGQSLNCPVCFQPMVNGTLVNNPLFYCKQCHGLLMPMEILSHLVEEIRVGLGNSAVQTPADREDLKRVIQCPKCNLRMDAHYYAGPGNVVVDVCDNCSLIWFDRGEVTRIARAPDKGDLERTYGF
jgi:LSD1 subclass zinc finger protein